VSSRVFQLTMITLSSGLGVWLAAPT
jgi:hypothetical protein